MRNAIDAIIYAREERLDVEAFRDVLERSGLAERRPVADRTRLERMLAHGNLLVTAREAGSGRLVGVARSLTDFAFCCYLSDLAVDRSMQKRGIGERLIVETQRLAGPQATLILLSAPAAMGFYQRIGLPQAENAFVVPRQE